MQTDFILEYTMGAVRVVIEDDGDVAYAYRYIDGRPAGLVWLYNRVDAPDTGPEWDRMLQNRYDKVPPNALQKIKKIRFEVPSEEDFNISYNTETKSVGIYIRGTLHATIGAEMYPGHCVLAQEEGPLALLLIYEGLRNADGEG